MSKTILVIDDDQDTLDLIEIVLKEEGYQVIASRFENNVDEISKIQPDLILLR